MIKKQYFSHIRPKLYSVISFLIGMGLLGFACLILFVALMDRQFMMIVVSEYLLFPYIILWLVSVAYLYRAYCFIQKKKWIIAEVGDMGIYYQTIFHRIRYIYYSQMSSIHLTSEKAVVVVLKNGKKTNVPLTLPMNELEEFVDLVKKVIQNNK